MMITFDLFVAEQAESRREFLKKLGKGLAVASSGIKPDLSAVKKVAKASNYVHRDANFDAYDALNYALDNMFEFGRAESDLSMPLDLQQKIGNKLQHMIIGHKYYAVPGGPSSLRPTDYDFYSSLMDNADEYGDMDEAIASSSATLQDVFDYPKIFKGADNIWKEKGRAGIEEIEDYIKNNVEGYIEADNEGETSYEGEPEPVDEDPRDYLERDYASGPHMNSFKPELSFNQFYLTEMPPPRVGNRFFSLALDNEQIKQMYEAGYSLSQIGEKLGINRMTVARRKACTIQSMGVERRDGNLYKNLDNEKIKQMYEDGFSSYEIGEELGVSFKTIIIRLRAMGVPIRPSGFQPFNKGSYKQSTSAPSQRTRNITGPGNVGDTHQTFSGSSQTVKTNLPGPRGGKGH